jgi:hypothetical protein
MLELAALSPSIGASLFLGSASRAAAAQRWNRFHGSCSFHYFL